MENVLEAVDRRVNHTMNEMLLKDFTIEEVGIALNQMAQLKVPSPNGFSACFFQKNWASIGEEVSQAVLHILNKGCMNKELNLSYIALIPRCKNPTSVFQFHPISLCNVLYKLISKTLANRLKVVLPDIISQTKVLLSRVD
jgi:hypothetical protein